jgi:hypothetical protein
MWPQGHVISYRIENFLLLKVFFYDKRARRPSGYEASRSSGYKALGL